jgi:hypothetical protein
VTDPAGAGRKMLTSLGFLLMGSMAHHFFGSTVRIRHGSGYDIHSWPWKIPCGHGGLVRWENNNYKSALRGKTKGEDKR